MKHYFTLLFICILSTAKSQQYIKINNKGQLKLLGSFDRELLSEEPFADWFNSNYDTFEIDKHSIINLKAEIAQVDSIQIFFGTWCGDSKREVPKFLKIMDEFNYQNIQFIGLDNTFQNYKQSPFGEELGLNIHRVPTFILYKDSLEVGRIVEHPVESFEKDLSTILNEKDYRPGYYIVNQVNNLLEDKGVEFITENRDSIVSELKPYAESYSALNTYGYKLFTSFQIAEAEAVFNLNCELFDKECNTYYTLARFYTRLGNNNLANNAVIQGLKIEPENKGLLELLSFLN